MQTSQRMLHALKKAFFRVAASQGLTSRNRILLWFAGLLFVWQVVLKEFYNLERSL